MSCARPPQSNKRAKADRADCLAAKEVQGPVALAPPTQQSSADAQVQPAHPPAGGVGMEGEGTSMGPTLVFKLSCSSTPFATHFPPQPFFTQKAGLRERGKGGCKDKGEQDGCERVDWAWGGLEPEQSSECPSFCTVRGGVRRQHLSELCMWVYFFYIFAISSSRPFPRLKKNKKPQW